MKPTVVMTNAPKIVLRDATGAYLHNVIELSKSYETVILLYEDDFSDRILAVWAEMDRLNISTKKLGEVFSGIEVRAFGLDDFPAGTEIELNIRESDLELARQNTRQTVYRSLLNELSLISARLIQPPASQQIHSDHPTLF